MGFSKKFSMHSLADSFGQSFRRFPVAIVLVLFLTCFLLYLNHGGDLGDKKEFFFIFYPGTGALLAVALSLLTEDFKSKWAALATQVIVHAAWLGISIYLSQFDRFSIPQLIAVSATVFAIGMSVFLICFYRRRHELAFWNFSTHTVLGLAISAAIGGALTLGLLLLVESLKMLFGIIIHQEVYMDIWTVCMTLLAPVLFMNLIPKGENKYLNEAPAFSRFAKGVIQYLFLPLLGLYIITLYAYGAKILYQWSLPVGGVSYLVTGSMVLMVLLIYLTHPLQHQEGNKMFKRVTRLLPVVMLPLLALMTVAIGRRLADYGITVSRLYLLVFNVWCYAVCLWLIITRNKRIWLIPASFAVILLLISVGPQSIANVTHRQLKKEARTAFAASGFKRMPLSSQQYEQWLKRTDPKVARAIDSKLHYLYIDYGYNAIDDLLAKDVITGRYSAVDEQGAIIDAIHDDFSNDEMISDAPVPQGYTSMTIVRGSDNNIVKVDGDRMTIKAIDGQQVEHLFEIDVTQLAAYDREKNPDGVNRPLMIDNGDALLVIDNYNITVNSTGNNYISFMGIMFTK